jgi:hypothetical protein
LKNGPGIDIFIQTEPAMYKLKLILRNDNNIVTFETMNHWLESHGFQGHVYSPFQGSIFRSIFIAAHVIFSNINIKKQQISKDKLLT